MGTATAAPGGPGPCHTQWEVAAFSWQPEPQLSLLCWSCRVGLNQAPEGQLELLGLETCWRLWAPGLSNGNRLSGLMRHLDRLPQRKPCAASVSFFF